MNERSRALAIIIGAPLLLGALLSDRILDPIMLVCWPLAVAAALWFPVLLRAAGRIVSLLALGLPVAGASLMAFGMHFAVAGAAIATVLAGLMVIRTRDGPRPRRDPNSDSSDSGSGSSYDVGYGSGSTGGSGFTGAGGAFGGAGAAAVWASQEKSSDSGSSDSSSSSDSGGGGESGGG